MTAPDHAPRIDRMKGRDEIPEHVSADVFRAAMRRWPSGVTIVTMLDGEVPHGMTASAFTSVSIDPPLVLIVIDQRWRSHDLIEAGGAFCVNILSDAQSDWSDRFAGRHGELADRFFDLKTGVAETGAPFLSDATAWLDCRLEQKAVAGDHTIFVGKVVASSANDEAGRPLIYHDGDYRRLVVEDTDD